MLDPQRTRPLLEASMSLLGSCWWVLDLRVRQAGRGGAVAGWAGAPTGPPPWRSPCGPLD